METDFDPNPPAPQPLPTTVRPNRRILAMMATAGIAAVAVGGFAAVAAADDGSVESDQPIGVIDVEFVDGLPLSISEITEAIGLGGDHGNMDNWDDCPGCGMG